MLDWDCICEYATDQNVNSFHSERIETISSISRTWTSYILSQNSTKKCLTDYVPLKTTSRFFLPTYKIHSFQISTLKLNFQAYATKRGNYVWWTKTVFCLICFCEDKKKIMLFLGQKYDHLRLQYFKLKLESSGNDSILRAEASFSWSSSQDTVSFHN